MIVTNRRYPLVEIDNLFSSFPWAGKSGQHKNHYGLVDSGHWIPRADTIEESNQYRIIAELPAMKKDDISVRIKNGTLVIAGERKLNKEDNDDTRYHRVERNYGSFYRKFRLPEDADSSKINADYTDGVLTISIDKIEQNDNTEITIN